VHCSHAPVYSRLLSYPFSANCLVNAPNQPLALIQTASQATPLMHKFTCLERF